MKDIQQLKDDYEQLDRANDKNIITFFEKNLESIHAINVTESEEHYGVKLRFQSEYGMSLLSAGYYTKANQELEKSIEMFKKSPTINPDKIYENNFFETLLWNYSVSLWESKEISKSITSFKELVEHYPKNEKYQAWLNGLKMEKIRKFISPVWIAAGIWLVGSYTFFKSFDEDTQLILTYLGVSLFVLGVVLELYAFVLKKRKVDSGK